jgi:hypothetical protein
LAARCVSGERNPAGECRRAAMPVVYTAVNGPIGKETELKKQLEPRRLGLWRTSGFTQFCG